MRINALLLAILSLIALGQVAGCDDDGPLCPPGDLGGGQLSARAWAVPAEMPTIAAALGAASSGDSILIAPGIYEEHDLLVEKTLLILGQGTSEQPVVIDAMRQGRVFDVAEACTTVTMVGLTITGGGLDGANMSGGGIRCHADSLVLVDCTLRDNSLDNGDGGGLVTYGRHLNMNECRFLDNSCSGYGGAVYCRYSGKVTVDDCLFEGNGTPNYIYAGLIAPGGGVVRNCRFESQAGDALKLGSDSLVSLTQFRNNQGQALILRHGCRVESCTFADNQSLYQGAALAALDSLVLVDSIFLRNSSDRAGGAVLVQGDSLYVENCDFLENQTSGQGGALKCKQARIVDTRFTGNTADEEGGALFGTDLTLLGCDFRGNDSGRDGGALFGQAGQLDGCSFIGNTGSYGVVFVNSVADLRHCTLAANQVPEGYGILQFGSWNQSGPFVLDCCLVAFNEGLAVASGAPEVVEIQVFSSNVFGNTAGDWVGLLEGLEESAGNLADDPLFCALEQGNVSLCSDSPCLPPQSGAAVIGARDAGCVACGDGD